VTDLERRALELLRDIEWLYMNCPRCGLRRGKGQHEDYCDLGNLIADLERKKEEG